MGNLITDRVAYFLKDYPPFNKMSEPDLAEVAQLITVKYYQPDEFIFREGDDPSGNCFVLNQGNVKLTKNEATKSILVDQCEPGDIFGVRAIITGNPYSMSAQCIEESLVYAFPQTYFQHLFESNNAFSNYFASGYAAGQIIVRADQDENKAALTTSLVAPKIEYPTDVITIQSGTIEEASKIMSQHNVGSIIISSAEKHPLGIITDTDLRNKVLATGLSPKAQVSSIMASPVKTITPAATLSEVMMEMIRSGVHHLVVTEDGTNQSEICGIVSDHDVVLSQQNHPASLIKTIKRSNNPSEWKLVRDKAEQMLAEYLQQEVKTSLLAALITKINDTIIEKAISRSLQKFPEIGEIEFTWLNLGSEGREEQLLRTDQDNAIVFSDGEDNEQSQEMLLGLAEDVNENLIECGFVKCPADIMARNPKYCQPVSAWKKYFSEWVSSPDPKSVMKSTIFFDYRLGYGSRKLVSDLNSHLVSIIKKNDIFLNFLAQNSLQNPPPLSFFKNFLVERSGEHKDEFDIKKRGMMPLADAARLLLLDHHVVDIKNTVERFEKLAEIEPNNRSLFEAAADSYEIFMSHRARNGLAKKDSGRFISLSELNKLEKQVLKNAFLSIKEVQDIVKVRFQQSYFS